MVFIGHEIVAGSNNKGDAMVTLKLTKSEGLKIELVSKFLVKYGETMDKSIRDVLGEANIANACIRLEDYGALDFVIKARVETAVKRALADKEG